MFYYRPIVQTDRTRPDEAHVLAGGRAWFSHVERIARNKPSAIIQASDVPRDILENLTSARAPICGLDMASAKIMAILNVTPDSFSDGGQHYGFTRAVEQANLMIAEGADLLDIGGESTRPGAGFVESDVEITRTRPVIEALKAAGVVTPLSIDTRKAAVARAALDAGAVMFNDVTALRYDGQSLPLVVEKQPFVCLMHSPRDPKTMQKKPFYDNVLLDIYDHLYEQVTVCVQAGISKDHIVIDPGIGFGKTIDHNLQLIRGMSLFHAIGCPILLGVSRKRFIGEIGFAQEPADRTSGSIAIALEGLRQGVQILRVHDVWQTRQAVRLWQATL